MDVSRQDSRPAKSNSALWLRLAQLWRRKSWPSCGLRLQYRFSPPRLSLSLHWFISSTANWKLPSVCQSNFLPAQHILFLPSRRGPRYPPWFLTQLFQDNCAVILIHCFTLWSCELHPTLHPTRTSTTPNRLSQDLHTPSQAPIVMVPS